MSNERVLDRWKSTPKFAAETLLRERAVMECLESLEAWAGATDSATCAAAALQVLEVSNDILGGGLGTFAGFLNEIRATQAEALDALHTQAGQLTAWVIAELWQPTHSRFPTDGQLGDETQLRFTQRWRKAVRTSVLSGEWDLTPEFRAIGYPNRARWLSQRLLERGWSTSDPYAHRGPDRKTLQRILQGYSVRNTVLERLASALSMAFGTVNVLDIPQD